jgi:hypothetical protein
MADEDKKQDQPQILQSNDVLSQIVDKFESAESVLIALSRDPSLDELAAAIGFCRVVDLMGKHGTAIFSGRAPAALEFLKPENTFESNTNSLQDFIIALSKDKADHLRYKVEGDFVKIFITPYKTSITEKDLEYSHGDYNVDLVVALNVAEPGDLDASLSEYGRILHNATTINITTGVPGKFGDIEWADPAASSVSEMLVVLTNRLGDKSALIDKDTATALLAGIIAATDSFKSKKATAETFMTSSELINAGADQAMIADNINIPDTPETETTIDEAGDMTINQDYRDEEPEQPVESEDPTKLVIDRGGDGEALSEVSLPLDEEKPITINEADLKPLPELAVPEGPEVPHEPTEEEKRLEEMMEAEKAKLDVPGPLADELKDADAVPPPDEKVDYAKQMEEELNDWVGKDQPEEEGAVPAEEPVAEAVTEEPQAAEPEAIQSMESAIPEQPGMIQGNDEDSYVINKPEKVIQPLGDVGIPSVAPLSEVVGAMEDKTPLSEAEVPGPEAMMPEMPSGDDGGLLPPPPPPPMPDMGAFKLPEMG